MLLHPELTGAINRKAFRQGLLFGGGRRKPTPFEQTGRNIANIAIREPRTIKGKIARRLMASLSKGKLSELAPRKWIGMSSLDDYIAFKKEEAKDVEERDEETKSTKSKKLKNFKKTMKYRRRSHAGGT